MLAPLSICKKRNETKEQLATAPVFYPAGKLDPVPKSHLRVRNKAPLSSQTPVSFFLSFFLHTAEDKHIQYFIQLTPGAGASERAADDGGGFAASLLSCSLTPSWAAPQRHPVVAEHKPQAERAGRARSCQKMPQTEERPATPARHLSTGML